MADSFIKKKREELGLSQSQFAEKSGVNLRSLQEYEQGRKPLSSVKGEVLYRISTALDCSMEDLIFEPVYPEGDASGRLYKYYIQFQELFRPGPAGAEPDHTPGANMYNTPFDDVFRTLSVDCSTLLLPVINEAFGEHYSSQDIVDHGQNEHLRSREGGGLHKLVSDSNFIIVSRDGQRIRYQLECQSTPDSSILLRIFEYASAIAAENAVVTVDRIHIAYPRSALIYLRSNDSTPDSMTIELDTPGGTVSWDVPVVKTQQFSVEDIFDRELYMFIPYYIMIYEKNLKEIDGSEDKLSALKDEFLQIRRRLDEAVQQGRLTEYDRSTICNMSMRILSYYSTRYENLGKEVTGIMGGQVLEYEAKTIRREAIREGLEEGRKKGLEEGRKKGLEEGRMEGRMEGRNTLIEELLRAGLINDQLAQTLRIQSDQ